MIDCIISFIVGILIGGAFGATIIALCASGKKGE